MNPFIVIGLILTALLLLWWGYSCKDGTAELALPAVLLICIGLVMIFDMKPGSAKEDMTGTITTYNEFKE